MICGCVDEKVLYMAIIIIRDLVLYYGKNIIQPPLQSGDGMK